jgi:putative endonuclease
MPLKKIRKARKESKIFGKAGEDYASQLLIGSGYRIITRNFKCQFGEIDIVATEGDTLVFVEVKTRLNRKFGEPQEAVTPQKLFKIKKVGEFFSLTHPTLPKKLRIDVVAITLDKGKISSTRIIKVF